MQVRFLGFDLHPEAVLWGGESPFIQNTIDSVEIASTGNAVDFGDLSVASKTLVGGCSNGHGGL